MGALRCLGWYECPQGCPNKYVLFDEIKLTVFTLRDWLGGAAVRLALEPRELAASILLSWKLPANFAGTGIALLRKIVRTA